MDLLEIKDMYTPVTGVVFNIYHSGCDRFKAIIEDLNTQRVKYDRQMMIGINGSDIKIAFDIEDNY